MKSKTVKIILAILLVGIISFLVVSCTKKEDVKVSLTSNGETIEEGSYADEYVMLSFESKNVIKKIIIINKKTNQKEEYTPELVNGRYVIKVKVEESATLEYYTVDEKGKESKKQEVEVKIDKEKPSFDMNEEKEVYTLNSYEENKNLIIKLTNIKDDSSYKVYYQLNKKNYQEINAKDNYDLKLNLNSGIYNINVKVVDESGKETIKSKQVEINYLLNIIDKNTVKQFKVINGERISYYANLPTNSNELFKGYSVDNENVIDNNYVVRNTDKIYALYDEEPEIKVEPKEEEKPQPKPVDPPKPSNKINKPTCNNSTYSGNEINLLNGNGNYTAENNKQTVPGTYAITASVMEGYTWNDDTTESITLNCEIKKNEITVTTESKSRAYDGTELKGSATVTKGNIYNNKIVYDTTSSITFVGTKENDGEIKVLDKNDTDVTQYFTITKVKGTLEITKNYISVETGSQTKIYDNTPLTNSVITLTKGTLATTDHLFFDNQATITNPGTKENTGVIKVLDSDDKDVTDNYSLNITYGTLKVTGEYNVTYSYNTDNYSNVTIAQSTKVIYHNNDAISVAPTATKEGWTFIGWNTDKTATTKLNEYKTTSDKTLYAIFQKEVTPKYVVSVIDGSEKEAQFSEPIYIYGENQTIKTKTPMIDSMILTYDSNYSGYTTYAFNEKSDLSMDKLHGPNEEITVGKDGLKLYSFRKKIVVVSYNTDGGSTVETSVGYAYTNINKAVKNYEISSLPTTTKTGYTFDGWYKEEGLTNKVTTVSTSSDMTLYAKWTKNTVKVTYGYNTDFYSGVTLSETTKDVGYNEDAITNAPTATKEGWTFVGWNTDKTSTTKLNTLNVTTAQTLYAIFKKDVTPKYVMTASDTVTFGDPVYIYKDNETVKIKVAALNTTYDTGYNGFATYAYNEKSDLSKDKLYYPNDEITVGKDGKTLYAFRKKTIVVKYNVLGVSNSMGDAYTNVNKEYINYESTSLPELTKEGFRFDGWYEEEGLTNKVTKISTHEDMTLYAKWTPTIVQVKSSYFDSFNVQVGDTIDSLPIVEEENKAFAGWYYGNELVDKDFELPETSSITLEPHFETSDVSASVIKLADDNTTLYMISNGIEIDKDFYKYNDDTISVVYEVKKQDSSKKAWESEFTNSVTTVTIENSFKLFKPTSMYTWFGTENSENKLTTINGLNNIDTSNVTSMSALFKNSKLTSIDLSSWNTSSNTSMSQMFQECTSLTSITFGNINTSNLNQMGQTFAGCSSLASIDLSKFNTSKVNTMSSLFQGCSSLETVNLQNFDFGLVTTTAAMFNGCSNIESILFGNVNFTSLTDIHGMFQSCEKLVTLDVSEFKTAKVIAMNALFYGCKSLETIDVTNWDVSKVTDMDNMFQGCEKLNKLDLGLWETKAVTTMNSMFGQCKELKTLNLINFDISNLTSANSMFNSCLKLETIYATDWTTVKTLSDENSSKMFEGCILLKGFDNTQVTFSKANNDGYFTNKTMLLNLSYRFKNENFYDSLSVIEFEKGNTRYTVDKEDMYDVSEKQDGSAILYVVDSDGKLEGHICSQLNMYLPDYTDYTDNDDVSDDTKYHGFLSDMTDLETVRGLENIDFSNSSSLKWLFRKDKNLKSVDLSNLDLSTITNITAMFEDCYNIETIVLPKFDKLNQISWMFMNCKKLQSLDLSNWDVSKVDNLYSLFNGCESLESIDLTGWTFENLVNCDYLFQDCKKIQKIDLSNWNMANVSNVAQMFNNCNELTNLYLPNTFMTNSGVSNISNLFHGCWKLLSLDVSNWNVSNVTNMQSAFEECYLVPKLDTSKWVNDGKVTDMSKTFMKCKNIKSLILTGINTSNVKDMNSLFCTCETIEVIDIYGWDTSKVTNMDFMFERCNQLHTIYATNDFSTASVIINEGAPAFDFDTNLVGGYGTTWSSEHKQIDYAIVDSDLTPGYFSDKVATIKNLIDPRNDYNLFNYLYIEFTTSILDEGDGYTFIEDMSDTNICEDVAKLYSKDDTLYISLIDDNVYLPSDCSYFFSGMGMLREIRNFSLVKSSRVIKCTQMFFECASLTNVDLSNFDTSHVTSMYGMFSNCESISTLNISNWNVSKVVEMENMFERCLSLTGLDLSNWNATSLGGDHALKQIFYLCENLTELDLSGFVTDTVTDFTNVFNGCHNIVTIDITGWNASKATWMNYMFQNCWELTTIYASQSFNAPSGVQAGEPFNYNNNLIGGNGTAWSSEHDTMEYARVDTVDTPGYFTLKNS